VLFWLFQATGLKPKQSKLVDVFLSFLLDPGSKPGISTKFSREDILIGKVTINGVLFPQNCFICGREGGYLCPSCQGKLPKVKFQSCPVCRRAAKQGETHLSCRAGPLLDGLVSLYRYNYQLKRIIKGFKFELVGKAASCLSDWLAGELAERPVLRRWRKAGFTFLPVPLYFQRERWRGFNQSAVLLENICHGLRLPFDSSLVVRFRSTKAQVKLGAKQRKANVKGAFGVKKPKFVAGRSFVIFDDVLTTGSTIGELGKVLKKSGAKEVWGLTVCR